jgi:hypothetical protein
MGKFLPIDEAFPIYFEKAPIVTSTAAIARLRRALRRMTALCAQTSLCPGKAQLREFTRP